MNAPPSAAAELVSELSRADAALAGNDTESANVAMAAAADICLRMQAAGVTVPLAELTILRATAERCGLALDRLRQELNAESFQNDNHRRGVDAYLAAARR
jgi:hypothetical protein